MSEAVPPQYHLNVVVPCDADEVELASDDLWSLGATAIEERRVGNSVELWTSLGDDSDLIGSLMADSPRPWRIERVDAGVADTWRQFVGTVRVDDGMVIAPEWLDDPIVGDDIVIRIEPGATFGLGNHPTTVGCARMLRHLDLGDRRVLDVGTGSGVLAIAAVMLGARHAHGVDINPASLSVVAANARLNRVGDRVSVSLEHLDALDGPFDVVLANILAPVLIELAPDLVRLTGDVLVISGLLEGAHAHVVAALAPLRVRETVVVDGWITLALGR